MAYIKKQKSKPKVIKEDLGQIFTPTNIASLMGLLLLQKGNGAKVLDPCVGANVLFTTINKLFPQKKLNYTGIEIDTASLNKTFFKTSSRKLIEGNYFDLPVSQKYDYIIMNPPYVRHEDLVNAKINNKEKILGTLTKELQGFNGRSNLYIYFFLKAYRHLNEGGRVVAICYDSWLYSEFGQKFDSFLKTYFDINSIIHFKHSAFDNAEVGATVIELTKGKTKNSAKPIRIDLHDKTSLPMLTDLKSLNSFLNSHNKQQRKQKVFNNQLFEPIGQRFNSVRRGVETNGNKFFYVDDNEVTKKVTENIIKDVKTIKKFGTGSKDARKIIMVTKDNASKLDNKTKLYFEKVKTEINKESEGYSVLKKMLKVNDSQWFVSQPVKPGNLLFNYYIRNRADFLYNKDLLLASNNFYIMDSKEPMLDLALLNSSVTNKSIFSHARNQGKGLKKLQLYEFKNVHILKAEILDKKSREQLMQLGQNLVDCERGKESDIIKRIDKILYATLDKATVN